MYINSLFKRKVFWNNHTVSRHINIQANCSVLIWEPFWSVIVCMTFLIFWLYSVYNVLCLFMLFIVIYIKSIQMSFFALLCLFVPFCAFFVFFFCVFFLLCFCAFLCLLCFFVLYLCFFPCYAFLMHKYLKSIDIIKRHKNIKKHKKA